MVRFPTLFFALLFTVTYVTAKQCTKKHPYVNLYCPIKTRYYEAGGTVVPLNDCEFIIKNFSYNGGGPDVYIFGFSNELNGDSYPAGTKLYEMKKLPLGKAYGGNSDLHVSLPDGVTWNDIREISVWCKAYSVNFGNALFPEL